MDALHEEEIQAAVTSKRKAVEDDVSMLKKKKLKTLKHMLIWDMLDREFCTLLDDGLEVL